MSTEVADGAIQAAIVKQLDGTPYAVSSLTSLAGGVGNFTYRAKLRNALPCGAAEVTIKHGEAYVAQHPEFAWTTGRCAVEVGALEAVAGLDPETSQYFEIRSPKLLRFNAEAHTQVQEYFADAATLKNYALKHFEGTISDNVRQRCSDLGQTLGRWLRKFHQWCDSPEATDFRALVAKNIEMQDLKKGMAYNQLLWKVKKLPELLESCKDELQEVVDMATAELADQTELGVIHGDFWTGNILLPDYPLTGEQQVPVWIVDWEMTQFGPRPEDLGQVIAELWELKLYKDIDAGLWIIRGFVEGYGKVNREFAFRTLVHIGAHLICIGSSTPGWGTEEQGHAIGRVGRDTLLAAWRKDEAAFEGHDLKCLLDSSS